MKVLARYVVLQIPGQFIAAVTLVMLVRWTELTPMLAGILFGLWVIKDFAMYPVTRIAYEPQGGGQGVNALLGALGVAQEDLAPEQIGYVRVGAELWRAQLCADESVAKGAAVRVTEVRDLTLQVEPVTQP
jgi:membrane protein implicated in regulation of membrane protease activity